MNIDHISFSRYQCFNLCQEQYKFKYHLAVKSDIATPIYFTFGKLIHKIIEEHTKSQGKRKLKEITLEIFNGNLVIQPGEAPPKLDNEYKELLIKHLINYMKLANKIGYDGEVEWKFDVDLDHPNERFATGYIDRLIIKNNHAFIIDYKTTRSRKWKKTSKDIIYDLQLACYSWVIMKEFNIPAENIVAALYYLDNSCLMPVKFSEKTLLSVPSKLLETYLKVEDSDADKVIGNVGNHCKNCDYRKICPFYRSSNENPYFTGIKLPIGWK